MIGGTEAPDLAGPVVAWRVWLPHRTHDEPFRLDSVINKCVWPARSAMVARCLHPPAGRIRHEAPCAGCRCGIYAVSVLDALRGYLGHPCSTGIFPRAVGLVSLWGSVIEHERGWRASHAYPRRLWLPLRDPLGRRVGDWEQMALGFADYGVPIETIDAGGGHELLEALRVLEEPVGSPNATT